MKKMAFGVLLLLMLQMVMLGPLYLVQQYRWKAQMMAAIKMDSNQLSVDELTISKKEFTQIKWLEEKKEFVFQGNYYDVIEIKPCGDKVVIRCVEDREESFLVEQYIAAGKGQKNPLHQGVKVLWSNLTLEEIFLEVFIFPFVETPREKVNDIYAFPVKEALRYTSVPPPNFV